MFSFQKFQRLIISKRKRAELQRELNVGIQQLEQGQYSEFSLESLPGLFDEIRREGRVELERVE